MKDKFDQGALDEIVDRVLAYRPTDEVRERRKKGTAKGEKGRPVTKNKGRGRRTKRG